MKRKRISILFLCIANIFLFAHSFFPNHTHCNFNVDADQLTHQFSYELESSCESPDNEPHDYENCCSLKQLLVVPPNGFRYFLFAKDDLSVKDDFYLLFVLISTNKCELLNLYSYKTDKGNAIALLFHKKIINLNSGLRAPPVIFA